jgi:hypothetical protein
MNKITKMKEKISVKAGKEMEGRLKIEKFKD